MIPIHIIFGSSLMEVEGQKLSIHGRAGEIENYEYTLISFVCKGNH